MMSGVSGREGDSKVIFAETPSEIGKAEPGEEALSASLKAGKRITSPIFKILVLETSEIRLKIPLKFASREEEDTSLPEFLTESWKFRFLSRFSGSILCQSPITIALSKQISAGVGIFPFSNSEIARTGRMIKAAVNSEIYREAKRKAIDLPNLPILAATAGIATNSGAKSGTNRGRFERSQQESGQYIQVCRGLAPSLNDGVSPALYAFTIGDIGANIFIVMVL